MRQKANWLLIIMLVIMTGTLIYHGSQKEGYHVDEIYSYGLANSEYLPFMHFGTHEYDVKAWMLEYGAGESLGDLVRNLIKDFKILKECDFRWRESSIYQDYLTAQSSSYDRYTTTWRPGQDYLDYVAVSESNTFNYFSVYYNQRGDVHPPLYYMILHTVCSIFQGTFSKWLALGINIVFAVLTMLLMYKMVKNYLGGPVMALAAVAAYAFSGACSTNVTFLRMYVMLMFFMVAACYIHLKIAHEDFALKGLNRKLLVLVTVGGFLTHYYFVFYAALLALVYIVLLAVKKRWIDIWKYCITLAGSAILGICVWPFAIKHIFFGYRGVPTWEALGSGELATYSITNFFSFIIYSVFGGKKWIVILAVLCYIVAVVLGKKEKVSYGRFCLVGIPVIAYCVIIAQVAPFMSDRYIMGTYPFWGLFMVGGVYALGWILWKRLGAKQEHVKWLNGIMALTVIGLFVVNSSLINGYANLSTGVQETVEVPENTDCIFVMFDGEWDQSAIDTTILMQCRNVGVIYYSDVPMLKEEYTYKNGDYLMVAIQKEMDIESVLAYVREVLGLEGIPELYRTYGNTSVRIMLRAE